MRTNEDGAIASAVTKGADDALHAESELCRRFVPRVFAYGLRHLGNRADAADLAQAVMCIVLEKLRADEVAEPARLASFVLGTARNVARAWSRGEARRREILGQAAPLLEELSRYELDTRVLEGARLVECMAALGAREQAIVMLTFFADRDGTEIAEELGMTPGNVRVARHRALASLRECVGGGVT